jgi:hypothetical protein
MSRRYNAFLIRHWSLESGLERTEVTHLQSGTTIRGHGLLQVIESIRALLAESQIDDKPEGCATVRGPPIKLRGQNKCDH